MASGHELNMNKQSERVPGLRNISAASLLFLEKLAIVENLLPSAWSRPCTRGDFRQIMRLRSKHVQKIALIIHLLPRAL